MKRDDYVAVVRLATTLIHKDLSELFTAESDLFAEAVDDLRAALRHTRPPRDNVVPVTSTAARDGRLGGNPRSLS